MREHETTFVKVHTESTETVYTDIHSKPAITHHHHHILQYFGESLSKSNHSQENTKHSFSIFYWQLKTSNFGYFWPKNPKRKTRKTSSKNFLKHIPLKFNFIGGELNIFSPPTQEKK